MVLFPSLAELDASTTSSNSIEPSTVLQLYVDTYINFWTQEVIRQNKGESSYRQVNYHAICTEKEEDQGGNNTRLPGGVAKEINKNRLGNKQPNLGIWNVHVDQSHITSKLSPDKTTFLWSIDLSTPSQVYASMQSFLKETCKYFDESSPLTFSFGQAISKSIAEEEEKKDGDEAPSFSKNQLIIAAIVPPHTTTTTFEEKQAQCLLQYHLHKFSAQVKATLIFVSDEDVKEQDNAEDMKTHGILVSDLAPIMHALCTKSDEQAEENKSVEFLHQDHDLDVIEVMLRNASCPGLWDANTQNLQDVFPATTSTGEQSNNNTAISPTKQAQNNKNDAWLEILADSLGDMRMLSNDDANTVVSTGTTSTKKSASSRKSIGSKSVKKGSRKSMANTGGEDVGSFFADLLKKP